MTEPRAYQNIKPKIFLMSSFHTKFEREEREKDLTQESIAVIFLIQSMDEFHLDNANQNNNNT